MKILLVQSYLDKDTPLVFPLGLSYLCAYLSKHELEVLDLNLYEEPYKELRKRLTEFLPEAVCVSLRNIDNQNRISICYFYKEFQSTIKEIKRTTGDIPLIVGGAGFSMFAREIMERNQQIDFGIFQEGEESLPGLLDNFDKPQDINGIFYRKNGSVIFTGKKELPDIKNVLFPVRDVFDLSKYTMAKFPFGVQTKRGCFLDCTYCNYPFLSGNKVRLRHFDNVVDEIQELLEKYSIDNFIFTDSVFNAPIKHARQICEEIIRRKLKVKWAAYFDIRFAEEDFLVLAKNAGCQDFIFSPDAVSKCALQGLNKGISSVDINRTVGFFINNEQLQQSHASFGFFLNAPGETLVGLVQTLFFYLKLKCILRGRGGSGVSWIRIEPDTGILKIAVENGILKSGTDLLPDKEIDLKDLFYSQPPLCYIDSFLLATLRALIGTKKLIKKLLKKEGL